MNECSVKLNVAISLCFMKGFAFCVECAIGTECHYQNTKQRKVSGTPDRKLPEILMFLNLG